MPHDRPNQDTKRHRVVIFVAIKLKEEQSYKML